MMSFRHVAVTASLLAAGAVSAQTLDVRLSTDQARTAGNGRVMVNVDLSNHSAQAVRVLKWQVPGQALHESLFRVTLNGKRVAYVGPLIKRAAPTANDYITVKPGATLRYAVDLSQKYDLSANGRYSVAFEGLGQKMNARTTNSLDLELSNRQPLARQQAEDAPMEFDALGRRKASVKFISCSASRQKLVRAAVEGGASYAQESLNYFNANKVTGRYTTWFGKYDQKRWNLVKKHFANEVSAFGSKTITVDCGCSDSSYAYVYSNSPYRIYVCNAFWRAPMKGEDSKSGTIVHEMAHFSVIAGTGDYGYGHGNAKALARSNPGRAVMNSDSHEYFAENTGR